MFDLFDDRFCANTERPPQAIKHNGTLKSFSMDAVGTRVGDETGLAMAEAIKHNGCLMWNHPCSGAKRFSVPYTAT